MILCLSDNGKISIVTIPVTSYLSAIATIEFHDFWKVVIDGIKFKVLFSAPFDCFRQSVPGAAGPEDEFVAIRLPFF
ncbi:hypothetical protein H0486_02640 [Lachnospiraceae bacterium MD1]|uniref:Uncharacterized protein n=1 Tax=Variimorphobacter saccharofermentans TaxID=2755051 RepID=A0A839JWL5_9FIRM|nr:hypothetical protein [Variimorphobacter saccharofermentans]MBB2181776.1 hypothetical protein [Variimorphobacter saccharofermentans]